jgi:PLD-like domain
VAFWMQEATQAGIRELRCQSGYFTLEGLSLLLPALKKCASNGSIVRLLIGSNQGVTVASHVAFVAGTLGVPRDNVSIGIVSFDGSLFHPKAYHVVRMDGTQTAYVGSANLTGPAIEGSNIESGVILDEREADEPAVLAKISNTVDAWFTNSPDGLSVINQPVDVDKLLASGHLSFTLTRQARGDGEEGEAGAEPRVARPRLRPIFRLPGIDKEESEKPEGPGQRNAAQRVLGRGIEGRRFLRNTEASYHYPQGTHPGHLLAILYYFSGDRRGTAFDDDYIRLNGSLGEGRLAAYRRQIKYKMLAAIELGLITDVRTVEDVADYEPTLTEDGQRLWSLLEPYLDPRDLVIEAEGDDELSSRMPKGVSFYIEAIRLAHAESDELRELLFSIILNTPAVTQLLQLLYHQERARVVSKARVYETYFDSAPVRAFCDEMGIEPATHEGSRHRCPFLINLLDACAVVTQSQSYVTVEKLALAPVLLIREHGDYDRVAELRFAAITSAWPNKSPRLSADDLVELRELFGDDFLTERYYLRELVKIPNG